MSKTKEYIIRKGCHYSNFFPRILFTTDYAEQGCPVEFTESCAYDIDEASCVNKLFGFCFGFGVHRNSARVGWTYNKETGMIDLWKYVYKDKELKKVKFHSVGIGETHDFKLCIKREKSAIPSIRWSYLVDFMIDGKLYEYTTLYTNCCFVTTLGPYFGGNTRAPHDIMIIGK